MSGLNADFSAAEKARLLILVAYLVLGTHTLFPVMGPSKADKEK